jgi:hypothetical protein
MAMDSQMGTVWTCRLRQSDQGQLHHPGNIGQRRGGLNHNLKRCRERIERA